MGLNTHNYKALRMSSSRQLAHCRSEQSEEKKCKLIYSTIEKKAVVLMAINSLKPRRPRIKKGNYMRVFGKLIDVSGIPE